MNFFFPDSQDLVDPSFDFIAETRSPDRLRQRDDQYAHELFRRVPYDGLLVSKAIVDGASGAAGKYTIAQRHRLLRLGAKEFFRLNKRAETRRLLVMGDCGAFSYVAEEQPPFSPEEVLQFYAACDFDLGLSVDHVILGYVAEDGMLLPAREMVPAEWPRRQDLTIQLAADFLRLHRRLKPRFLPVGVAQGWSPESYAFSIHALQRIGYRRIALGGMVSLRTDDILSVLSAAAAVRRKDVEFHLLGVTRTEQVVAFRGYGVTSFDSTSPLRRAFKDAKENYFTMERSYTAIRIPQVQGNPKLQRLISSGSVDQGSARKLEQHALRTVRSFDRGKASLTATLSALAEFESLFRASKASQTKAYEETLSQRPWKNCPCDVCTRLGVEVILFRGAERNRRRGFHNTWLLHKRLRRLSPRRALRHR